MHQPSLSKGFTFLEILFAMVFFMVIISTFAMVFPSGYHLNMQSYRENQAVRLADAILQEVASKPADPNGAVGIGDSLQNLQGWRSTADWTPQALTNFVTSWPNNGTTVTLPPATSATPGIVVSCVPSDANCFNPNAKNDNPLVQITVNLAWISIANGVLTPRIITLTTYVTANRQGQ